MDATHPGMTILAVREIESGEIAEYECVNYDTARALAAADRGNDPEDWEAAPEAENR